MTILAIIALVAALCLISWLLNQWPVFWRRLAVVFALSWLGYGVVYLADMRNVGPTGQAGIAIALGIGAIAAALFVLQPLTWGIDDWLAERDAAEVQP